MVQMIVLPHTECCPEGKILEVTPGMSICEALLDNNIEIEHACEMSCACTTCHIFVRHGRQYLTPQNSTEEDLLDRAWGVSMYSRLSCQAIISNKDLTVEIPRYSINQVKE